MRIGVDFDNTLACYDGAFHAIAVERGLFSAADVATDKTSVRNHLRTKGLDAAFTELQGYVYGPGMEHVHLYPGAAQALQQLKSAGADLFVVSHKTRFPFAGPNYDLHRYARAFLRAQGLTGGEDAPFLDSRIFLEETKEDKVARAATLLCDVFIDDLPEILDMSGFPAKIQKLLFDPDNHFATSRHERVIHWSDIQKALDLRTRHIAS